MRPSPKTTTKQRRQYVNGINARGRAFRHAEKKLDDCAVCLIGWEKPGPKSFGDNKGIFPHRMSLSKHPIKSRQACRSLSLSFAFTLAYERDIERRFQPLADRLGGVHVPTSGTRGG